MRATLTGAWERAHCIAHLMVVATLRGRQGILVPFYKPGSEVDIRTGWGRCSFHDVTNGHSPQEAPRNPSHQKQNGYKHFFLWKRKSWNPPPSSWLKTWAAAASHSDTSHQMLSIYSPCKHRIASGPARHPGCVSEKVGNAGCLL